MPNAELALPLCNTSDSSQIKGLAVLSRGRRRRLAVEKLPVGTDLLFLQRKLKQVGTGGLLA